jgi:signal transduction histidine kinase
MISQKPIYRLGHSKYHIRCIGIHPDILPRLFQKFATKSYQGTGLGLYISKSIVEAHGGRMWAENNSDGKGATFAFALPVVNKLSLDITESLINGQ